MQIKSGTIGEVVPGSGLNYYPAKTTAVSVTSPHLGYVATLGYFGETLHYGDLQNGFTAPPLANSPDIGSNAQSQSYNGTPNSSTTVLKQITTLAPFEGSVAASQEADFSRTGNSGTAGVGVSYNITNGTIISNITNSTIGVATNLIVGYTSGYGINVNARFTNSSASPIVANDYEVNGSHSGTFDNMYSNSGSSPLEYDPSMSTPVTTFKNWASYHTGGDTYENADTIHALPTIYKHYVAGAHGETRFENNRDIALQMYSAVGYYPNGPYNDEHLSSTVSNVTGSESPSSTADYWNGKDGDFLQEPGYYTLTKKSGNAEVAHRWGFTQTPVVVTAGGAKLDGSRGKGKEWVMIEK
jgi:hypothetical protein